MSSSEANLLRFAELTENYQYENSKLDAVVGVLEGKQQLSQEDFLQIKEEAIQDVMLDLQRMSNVKFKCADGRIVDYSLFEFDSNSSDDISKFKGWIENQLFKNISQIDEKLPEEREMMFWKVLRYFHQGVYCRLDQCAQGVLAQNDEFIAQGSQFKNEFDYKKNLVIEINESKVFLHSDIRLMGKILASGDLEKSKSFRQSLPMAYLKTSETKEISLSDGSIRDISMNIENKRIAKLSPFFELNPKLSQFVNMLDKNYIHLLPASRQKHRFTSMLNIINQAKTEASALIGCRAVLEEIVNDLTNSVFKITSSPEKKRDIEEAKNALIYSKDIHSLKKNFAQLANTIFTPTPSKNKKPANYAETRSSMTFLKNIHNNKLFAKLFMPGVGMRGLTNEDIIYSCSTTLAAQSLNKSTRSMASALSVGKNNKTKQEIKTEHPASADEHDESKSLSQESIGYNEYKKLEEDDSLGHTSSEDLADKENDERKNELSSPSIGMGAGN